MNEGGGGEETQTFVVLSCRVTPNIPKRALKEGGLSVC